LVEVLERIRERSNSSQAKLRLLVREHVLLNIYGFEYLIAPYTIAHLKLSQYLKDRYNYVLEKNERLAIYLTNTLEPVEPQKNFLLPQLTKEVEQAQRVKEKQPILVITGNPPYNKFSRNKGRWITSLLNVYRKIDGAKVNEGTTWITDDYVKFIRFAQWKMEQVEQGIVGIITNHSFLDNPTFRGMRHSLMSVRPSLGCRSSREPQQRRDGAGRH
jgi:predicted helicase